MPHIMPAVKTSHDYENSWIELDGQRMQSMTGGGHWGGGMFISARDMARFGYLFLRNGSWKGRGIVSPKWIEMARSPGPANKNDGCMNWFLNTNETFANAPASAVTFQGNGGNIIYIDIYIDWETISLSSCAGSSSARSTSSSVRCWAQ
jgi:CubicO group peptidase (beta-lactamase class C family)